MRAAEAARLSPIADQLSERTSEHLRSGHESAVVGILMHHLPSRQSVVSIPTLTPFHVGPVGSAFFAVDDRRWFEG